MQGFKLSAATRSGALVADPVEGRPIGRVALSTLIVTIVACLLAAALGVGRASASTGTALNSLPLRDALTTPENPMRALGFEPLEWDTTQLGTHEGSVRNQGWFPYGQLASGAWWGEQFKDTGTGVASSIKVAGEGRTEINYSAVWVDMPDNFRDYPNAYKTGYELQLHQTASGVVELRLSKWASGTETLLASKSGYAFPAGSSFAIVDKGGTVSAWTNTGSGYTQVLSAASSTYTSGYGGFEGRDDSQTLQEFRSGVLPSS